MSRYNLIDNGDDLEKRCWRKFVKTSFPNYELFWQKHIVGVTNRSKNINDIGFKDDAELIAEGLSDHNICKAQLHYTILAHLERVYKLVAHYDPREDQEINFDEFIEGIIRLCSALDVADELLQRHTSDILYDPWSDNESSKARRDWRSVHNSMQYLRDYRNRIIHGRMMPSFVVDSGYLSYRIPKVGHEKKYLDWRNLAREQAYIDGGPDFDMPDNILGEEWCKTLLYLNDNWGKYLLV